jgi:hypothetical protein
MGAIKILRGDPTATPLLVVVLAPITIAIAFLTIRLLASYRRGPGHATLTLP